MSLLSAISGVALALGAEENIVQLISGAALAIVTAVVYIITEGKIDAAAVAASIETTQKKMKNTAS
ncbi:hypothetical protein SDC9_157880 [bioreactor metagenome]|uniref:Uncharacterized protein n=1 Tax=bioreactor metagenome TaxID=1076179 RepID=A0A645F889_9ZZZZ